MNQFTKPKLKPGLKEYVLEHKIITIIVLVALLGGGFGIKHYFFNSVDYSNYQPLPSDSPSPSPSPTDIPSSTPTDSSPTPTDTPAPTAVPTSSPTPAPSAPVGIPSGSYSTLSANPSSVKADNSTQMALTVTIRDGNNTPITGATLTLQSSGGGQTFTSSSNGSNITNGSGQAFFNVISNAGGSFSVSAYIQYGGGNNTTLSLGSITFKTIPTPDAGHSTVNANPSSVPADGSTTSTVTVNLKDSSGNSVPSDTISITLNSTDSNLKINGSTASSASTNADSNGQATFTLTSTSSNTQDTFTVTDTTMNVPLNTQLIVTFN